VTIGGIQNVVGLIAIDAGPLLKSRTIKYGWWH